MRHAVGLLAFVAVLLVGTAAGEAVTELAGLVQHESAFIVGLSSFESPALGAFHLSSTSAETRQSFELTAAVVVVNRTYETRLGVGTMPTSPDKAVATYPTEEGSRERAFNGAAMSGDGVGSRLGTLILPSAERSAQMTASAAGAVDAWALPSEAWLVGFSANYVNASVPDSPNPMDRYYQTVPGQPGLSTSSDLQLTVRGDFVVHLWGPQVLVGNGAIFRSGEWEENVTTARRDHYAQLVELRVQDGTLSLTQERGTSRWTAPVSEVETDGTVRLAAARGSFETGNAVYTVDGQNLEIQGPIQHTISAGPEGLRSEISAARAEISLPASAAVPRTTGSGPAWNWTLIALGVAMTGGAGFGVWRHRDFFHDAAYAYQIGRVDRAMHKGFLPEALERTQRLVERHPLRGEAWSFWGDARMRAHGAKSVLKPLKRVETSVDRPAHVQFMLAIAYLDLDDDRQADAYMAKAWQDEDFVKSIQKTVGALVKPSPPRTGPASSPGPAVDDFRGYA